MNMANMAQLKAKWNQKRNKVSADFYTIGYSGFSASEFVAALQEVGVSTLIDIRRDAVSMHRPEFSKTNLRQMLEVNGIAYTHYPALGVPRDLRARVADPSGRNQVWHWYDSHVAPTFAGRNLDRFFNGYDHPIALMCVEADPRACHRHRLAMALEVHGLKGYDL